MVKCQQGRHKHVAYAYQEKQDLCGQGMCVQMPTADQSASNAASSGSGVSRLIRTWKMIAAKLVMTGIVIMELIMPHNRAA